MKPIEEMTDEEFFGTKDTIGFYKTIIAERNKRLHIKYMRERISKK